MVSGVTCLAEGIEITGGAPVIGILFMASGELIIGAEIGSTGFFFLRTGLTGITGLRDFPLVFAPESGFPQQGQNLITLSHSGQTIPSPSNDNEEVAGEEAVEKAADDSQVPFSFLVHSVSSKVMSLTPKIFRRLDSINFSSTAVSS